MGSEIVSRRDDFDVVPSIMNYFYLAITFVGVVILVFASLVGVEMLIG